MSLRRNLIITAANGHIDSFLVHHWLPSLLRTIHRNRIDIVVLDYGLRSTTKRTLARKGVIVVPCRPSGHIVNSRLRDTAEYIKKHSHIYAQVLCIDSGDVIFQSDMSTMFRTDTNDVRITSQHMPIDVLYLFSRGAFTPSMYRRMLRIVLGKPVLNAGVIVAPAEKMRALLEEAHALITNPTKFLPDQMAINYILHRDGYSELAEEYNFMKLFSSQAIRVENGVVKTSDGRIIPILHNCGGKSYLRAFSHFGIGPDCNVPNQPVYLYTEVKAALYRAAARIWT